MSANIWGDRFLGYRTPAWHHLGTTFTDPTMTTTQAVKQAGLDYNFFKAPLIAMVEQTIGKGKKATTVTVPVEVTNQFALMREATPDDNQPRFLGTVSENYPLVQNLDIARILDTLNDEWPVETVGALGIGETIFITLDAGSTFVLNNGRGPQEELHQYFLVTDTRDGKTAMKLAFTPVRVVCQNTLITGLSNASFLNNIPHLQGMEDLLKYRVELLSKITKMRDETMDVFAMLAKSALQAGELASIVASAYPYPSRPKKAEMLDVLTDEQALELGDLYGEANNAQQVWEYYCGRVDTYRQLAGENLFRMNDEHPAIANTAWAAYNSVVETEDFRDGPETLFISAMFGDRARAKVRAFRTARDVAEHALAADIKQTL